MPFGVEILLGDGDEPALEGARCEAADGFQLAVDAGLRDVARDGQGLHARLEAVLAEIVDAGAGAGFEADDHLAVDIAGLPGG